jgi:hypothetical protein
MSLQASLLKNVEIVLQNYIDTISQKFNIDRNELISIWNGGTPAKSSIDSVNTEDISIERLNKCNKAELVALCKSRGCKCTGTKELLIQRLTGSGEEVKTETKKKPKKSGGEEKEGKEEKQKPKKAGKKFEDTPLYEKIRSEVPVIAIRKNKFDNLAHLETGLVFDRKTETVIGKQQDDGTISELTDEDIESCKQFKFKYNIPFSLDKKDDLENVVVDGLDDEDIVVDEGEEEDVDVEEIEDDVEEDEDVDGDLE